MHDSHSFVSHRRVLDRSGAGVAHIIGNDSFCIAAINGLTAVGYDGAVTSISQCITDATREGVTGGALEGVSITSTMAVGAGSSDRRSMPIASSQWSSTFGRAATSSSDPLSLRSISTAWTMLASRARRPVRCAGCAHRRSTRIR